MSLCSWLGLSRSLGSWLMGSRNLSSQLGWSRSLGSGMMRSLSSWLRLSRRLSRWLGLSKSLGSGMLRSLSGWLRLSGSWAAGWGWAGAWGVGWWGACAAGWGWAGACAAGWGKAGAWGVGWWGAWAAGWGGARAWAMGWQGAGAWPVGDKSTTDQVPAISLYLHGRSLQQATLKQDHSQIDSTYGWMPQAQCSLWVFFSCSLMQSTLSLYTSLHCTYRNLCLVWLWWWSSGCGRDNRLQQKRSPQLKQRLFVLLSRSGGQSSWQLLFPCHRVPCHGGFQNNGALSVRQNQMV